MKGGNSKIVDKLAETIGIENIILKTKVEKVEQKHNTLTAYCNDGKKYQAEKIICTAPTFSILKIISGSGIAERLLGSFETNFNIPVSIKHQFFLQNDSGMMNLSI